MSNTTKTPFAEKQDALFAEVTAQIVASIETTIAAGGKFTWIKPWSLGTRFQNAVSKKAYRGINQLLLSWTQYEDNRFITFVQAATLAKSAPEGFRFLKEGEKTCAGIFFWGFNEKKDKTTGETLSRFGFLKQYRVFNVAQTNLIEAGLIPECAATIGGEPFAGCDIADAVIRAYVQREGFEVREGGAKASYSPSADVLSMPNQKTFIDPESWYRTFFHELIHSTGAKTRLNRDSITGKIKQGSEEYAEEELTAELGSAMLAAYFGIGGQDTSAAYIGGWLKRLQNDVRLIERAARTAQKAVDMILPKEEEEVEGEEEGA